MTKQETFISKVAPAAQAQMKRTKILASLTIAQSILESGWGTSKLTTLANNLFGIKGKTYDGKFIVMQTREFEKGHWIVVDAPFRKYEKWADSIYDHADFLRKDRYKSLWGEKDYKQACHKIQEAGYATDPHYADQLIRIIEQYKLNKYDTVK